MLVVLRSTVLLILLARQNTYRHGTGRKYRVIHKIKSRVEFLAARTCQ